MHIAVTSLWLLPVVHCNAGIRIAWMLASALAHVGLSYWFNFVWVNTDPNGIDGGPLGFLTWTVPAIVGTIACDVFLQHREKLHLFFQKPFWRICGIASFDVDRLGNVLWYSTVRCSDRDG